MTIHLKKKSLKSLLKSTVVTKLSSVKSKEPIETICSIWLGKSCQYVWAKTQYSFSDNPTLLGAPEGFDITIREFVPKTGAGFIVALTSDVMTMPGLPKKPAALNMDVAEDGTAIGLF